MEERGFGLTVIDIRKLVYQMANKFGVHGFSEEKKSAVYDWWIRFSERHSILSMLNPPVAANYFDKLRSVMESLGVKDTPQQLYNANESGIKPYLTQKRLSGIERKDGYMQKQAEKEAKM